MTRAQERVLLKMVDPDTWYCRFDFDCQDRTLRALEEAGLVFRLPDPNRLVDKYQVTRSGNLARKRIRDDAPLLTEEAR